MKATFKLTLYGFLNILAKILSRMEDNTNININGCYPGHTMSLSKAGLNMKNYPTLKELWENSDEREKK